MVHAFLCYLCLDFTVLMKLIIPIAWLFASEKNIIYFWEEKQNTMVEISNADLTANGRRLGASISKSECSGGKGEGEIPSYMFLPLDECVCLLVRK